MSQNTILGQNCVKISESNQGLQNVKICLYPHTVVFYHLYILSAWFCKVKDILRAWLHILLNVILVTTLKKKCNPWHEHFHRNSLTAIDTDECSLYPTFAMAWRWFSLGSHYEWKSLQLLTLCAVVPTEFPHPKDLIIIIPWHDFKPHN